MTSSEPKTSRGRESRERILAAAADLIHRHGVHGTSVDQVLEASGAGKSQFYHYFEDKDDLVRAVLDYQVDRIFDHQAPYLARLDSFAGIAAWMEAVVASHEQRRLVGGCPIGTLASEMADWDRKLAAELEAVFQRWERALAAGLARMQERGELRPDADPETLACFVVAVQQGAVLLARTGKDVAPLRTALEHALRYLRSYGRSTDRSSETWTAGEGTEPTSGDGSVSPTPRTADRDWASWL